MSLCVFALLAFAWCLKCGLFFTGDRFVKVLLKIPYIRLALHDFYALRLLESLKVQVDAGIGLDKAVETSFEASGHPHWQGSGELAGKFIREGNDASEAFNWLYDFPKPLPSMFEVAVESGTIPSVLKQAIKMLEANLEYNVTQMTTALQPILILAMGGVAGSVILMVMTPLMRVMQALA